MYAGYTDGTLLFAVGMAGREISAGTLHRAVGEIDSADFVLPPSNTMRDVPIKRASVISIQKDGVEIFRGSAADTSTDLRGGRTYSVDGAMLWLADIRKPPFVMTEDTVTYYVTALLTQYNAACLPAKQIQLGTIDTTLPSLAVEQTEYKTILALLQEGMQAVGGTLRIRYEDGGIYLDVLKAYNHRCAQQVDIRKNLLDLTDKIDGADLITRVYPIGKDGLTIAGVNDGATYLANAAAEALYGRIDGTLRVDTDDAAALKAAAATYLAQNCGLSRGIQVSAADLSGTDITLEPYHIGDSVRVVSPPHGIDTIMTVSKLDTSLVGGKDTMTLGWSSRTLTGAVASGGGGSSSGTTTSGGGGTIDVDSALSPTSTNPIQNKAVKAALDDKLDKTGGTLTGNLTGEYITGTWLRTMAATDLNATPARIPVLDSSGWLYYRTLAEIKADIAATVTGADYILSQGTTGVWTWRKWASGIAEMWGIFEADSLAVDTAWGSVYYGTWMHVAANKNGRKYPFAFTDAPVVTATPYSPSTDFWLLTDSANNVGTALTHAPAYACVLPRSSTITNPQIHYHVVGKYK